MTREQRDAILEAADILRYLGGNNGFSNLQPKIRKMCAKSGNTLKKLVEDDIRNTQQN